jgi:hypothetical protein
MQKPEPRQGINVELCDLALETNLNAVKEAVQEVIAEVTNGGIR